MMTIVSESFIIMYYSGPFDDVNVNDDDVAGNECVAVRAALPLLVMPPAAATGDVNVDDEKDGDMIIVVTGGGGGAATTCVPTCAVVTLGLCRDAANGGGT